MRYVLLFTLGALLLTPFGELLAQSGTLYMRPDRATYSVGDGLVVELLVNTGGAEIQAVEATLNFDPAGLEVEKIVTDNSILSTWPTVPTFSNDAGTISFSGWTDSVYAGNDGYLATVYFRTPRNAPGTFTYESGAILAADGVGSNIIGTMRSGVYTVTPRSEVAEANDDPSSVDTLTSTTTPESDVVSEVSQEAPEKPVISQYQKTITAGDRIEIKGTTSPNSKIIVYMTHADGEPEQASISSESDGGFTFTSPVGTTAGVYRVWAVQESIDGVKSEPTDKIAITVRQSTVAAVGSAVTAVGSLVVPFIILVVLVGLSLGYYFFRRSQVAE